jgi:hypothetical protein
MTSQGTAHGRFTRAIKSGHLVNAEMAARNELDGWRRNFDERLRNLDERLRVIVDQQQNGEKATEAKLRKLRQRLSDLDKRVDNLVYHISGEHRPASRATVTPECSAPPRSALSGGWKSREPRNPGLSDPATVRLGISHGARHRGILQRKAE